jgi:uncharacterized damage-inducible protein DinB
VLAAETGRRHSGGMDEKETLQRYLSKQRADLLAKLDGLDEYDARRPLVASGTNLLGLVKHVASVQLGYLGEVFGRPSALEMPWLTDTSEPEADLWATEDETREAIVAFALRSAEHADATVAALDLDSPGVVPWWPADRREVTLHSILVHLCVETARHAGHADVVRELVDGRLGNGPADPNVPERDDEGWRAHHDRIEAAARAAGRQEATR